MKAFNWFSLYLATIAGWGFALIIVEQPTSTSQMMEFIKVVFAAPALIILFPLTMYLGRRIRKETDGEPFFMVSHKFWDIYLMPIKITIENTREFIQSSIIAFVFFLWLIVIMFVISSIYLIFTLPFLLIPAAVYLSIAHVLHYLDDRSYGRNTGRWICVDCGSSRERPVYISDSQHLSDLYPGVNGLYHREYLVHGCSEYVDCTNFGGHRYLLKTVCDNCGAVMDVQEARPFVISVAGAPGSGKTAYIYSSMHRLNEILKKNGYCTEYMHADYVQHLLNQFVFYNYVENTSFDYPTPMVLGFGKDSGRLDSLIYYFDICGRYFIDDCIDVNYVEQYNYTDGFIFTVNPISSNAMEVTDEAFMRFINKIHMNTNLVQKNGMINVKLAIVITHSDLNHELNEDMDSNQLKGLLYNKGFINFVNSVINNFSTYHFFSVCNFDFECKDDPLTWIVKDIFAYFT